MTSLNHVPCLENGFRILRYKNLDLELNTCSMLGMSRRILGRISPKQAIRETNSLGNYVGWVVVNTNVKGEDGRDTGSEEKMSSLLFWRCSRFPL